MCSSLSVRLVGLPLSALSVKGAVVAPLPAWFQDLNPSEFFEPKIFETQEWQPNATLAVLTSCLLQMFVIQQADKPAEIYN